MFIKSFSNDHLEEGVKLISFSSIKEFVKQTESNPGPVGDRLGAGGFACPALGTLLSGQSLALRLPQRCVSERAAGSSWRPGSLPQEPLSYD